MSTSTTRLKWLREFNTKEEDPFKFLPNQKTIFCKACECTFTGVQKSQLQQHASSKTHSKNSNLKLKRSATQANLEDLYDKDTKKTKSQLLSKDLCEAMLSANIPWSKLKNKKFKGFLESNIGICIPNEKSLRSSYLTECHDDVLTLIRGELRDSPIWCSVDETTDSAGRYVANILIGKLDRDCYHSPYVVRCAFLEKTNSSTVAQLVNSTLYFLWSTFNVDNLKLLVTDGAPYMLKCGRSLAVFFPSMLHVTCLAHGLHRICETIRAMFENVNSLISLVKKIFLKAPSRISVWKECNPTLPLPPSPIVTRWGTWIDASLFYAKHFVKVREVIEKLDPDDSIFINKCIEIMEDPQLLSNLTFIESNLAFLPSSIQKLEEAGLTMSSAIHILKKVELNIEQIGGTKGDILLSKFRSVISKNPDLSVISTLSNIMLGEKGDMPEGFSPSDIAAMKFAPLVSVDVERSFSLYRNILTDRRQNLSEENIEKIVVTNYFYNRNNEDIDE